MSFDLRALESAAAHVVGVLDAGDPVWQGGDALPVDGVLATGRISAAGAGKFYFSGRLSGDATGACRRCLEDVVVPVDEEVHLIFVDPSSDEADQDDVHIVETRGHELDLRPALREEWLLAVPAYVVCSESCHGLCPKCGANLNAGPCTCPSTSDDRWQALSAVRDSLT